MAPNAVAASCLPVSPNRWRIARWNGRGCWPRLACQVTDIEDVGGDVCRVLLRTPAGKPLRYHAGQYLLLERPDGELSAFSIASAPHEERLLELHILTREPSTRELVEHLRTQRL